MSKKRGRPTKYRPIFVKRAKDYYEKCLKENVMPFIEDLELILGVSNDSITRYCEANKDFCGAVDRINSLQRKSLKKIALGNYNGAIFLLKANHGLVEKQHVLLSGAEGEEPITYVISKAPEPEEKNNKPI